MSLNYSLVIISKPLCVTQAERKSYKYENILYGDDLISCLQPLPFQSGEKKPKFPHLPFSSFSVLASTQLFKSLTLQEKSFLWAERLREQCHIMDVDFWTSSDHSVKHVSASAAAVAQFNSASEHFAEWNSQLSALGMSEEDEARAFFPCPFCYTEIELPVFCTHLQDEHCFDLRNAICPLCAENLGKNPVEHFSMQHTQSIRRRRKSQNFGICATDQPGPGKELRDLSSYLGSASGNTKNNKYEADPRLSPFLFHTPRTNNNNYLQDNETFKIREFTWANEKRNTWKPEDESEEQDSEEKQQRTVFVEDLVMSTIF